MDKGRLEKRLREEFNGRDLIKEYDDRELSYNLMEMFNLSCKYFSRRLKKFKEKVEWYAYDFSRFFP